MVGGLALTLAACDAEEATEDQDEAARMFEDNGFRLNGFRLNGFRLNGFRLNGLRLDGDDTGDWIELEKITLGGNLGHLGVQTSWLAGSNLHVKTWFGWTLSGAQLIGSTLEFTVSEGLDEALSTTKVRIKNVAPLGLGSDVLLYDLAILDEEGAWQPLCVDSDDEPTQAILIGDVWDPDTGDRVSPRPEGAVTFACRDAALSKCVEWGYAPWRSKDGVPLLDYHQACTRAVRADYCGDGTPHTVDGLLVHFLDDLGILLADLLFGYKIEAEWGPDGATCLNPNNTRLPNPDLECSLPKTCGDDFESGGLLQTGKSSL